MSQWHPISKLLHWLMAALLLAASGLGFSMTRLANQAEQSGDYSATLLGLGIFDAYQLHKSIGVLLFALIILRVAVRSVTSPASHPAMPQLEATVSHAVHVALYGVMGGFPLSGWLLASSSPLQLPTVVFGLFQLPHAVGPDEAAEQVWAWVHFLAGLALAALATLHIAAAIKHHLWDRDGVLLSMLPVWAQPNHQPNHRKNR